MTESSQTPRAAPRVSGLLVLLSVLFLVRGGPLLRMYSNRLGVAIGSGKATGVAAALALAFLLLFAGIRKAPRSTAAGVGLLSLFLVIRSGNALALLLAAALLGFTLLAGDGVARLIRGRETEGRELSILIATGAVALGITLLALGEFRLVQ